MEGQSKGLRGLEVYCKGGQGPPQAVEPSKKKKKWCGIHVSQANTLKMGKMNFVLGLVVLYTGEQDNISDSILLDV
jgi:hypothetical protein